MRNAKQRKRNSWKGKYRPFLLMGRAVGLDSGPGPAVLGRLHSVIIAGGAVGLAVLTTLQIDPDELEDSSATNTAIDRLKTIVGSLGAAACCLMSLSHRTRLVPVLRTLDRTAESLLDPGKFSLRPVQFRSLALAAFLVANTVYEIIKLNLDYEITEFSYLVEYYSHLVIQAGEFQFVGLARSLGAMFGSLRSRLADSRGCKVRSRVRTYRLLVQLSLQVGDLFGPLLFVALLANFIIVLNNLYFSLMYLIRMYSGQGNEVVPASTLMYLNLNLYILLRTLEVLAAAHYLYRKAKEFSMDFEDVVLHDVTRSLQIDETIVSQLETNEDLVLYAGDMLILDYSLLIDMAGAWTTFLVVLLQFQLKPCMTSEVTPTKSIVLH